MIEFLEGDVSVSVCQSCHYQICIMEQVDVQTDIENHVHHKEYLESPLVLPISQESEVGVEDEIQVAQYIV